MTLNMDAPTGDVTVQIPGGNDKPVDGFTRKDCASISGDVPAAPVRWKKPLALLKGKPIRLEFFLKNARLFAFDLAGSPAKQ